MNSNLYVLQTRENESREVLREMATAFRRPTMLYSIGTDSSVLLHLAHKAFAPGLSNFSLMHVGTAWKLKEMIYFRDKTAEKVVFELLGQTTQVGIKDGTIPFSLGAPRYTRIMKPVALREALEKHGCEASIRSFRENRGQSQDDKCVDSIHQMGPQIGKRP